MGKRMVVVMWFLPLCAVVLVLPAMMLPDIAFAQQPTLVMNPTHGPAGTLIPVLGNAHQAIPVLTQMITLAMQNGGEGQEAQLEALTQQIEVLPKPQRGDRKAARLQNDKGLEAFKKKRYEQAVQFFLTAYQLDAGDVEVVNNVGMAYLKTGNLPEAARYLGGALSLAPNRAAAWGNLAEVIARDSRLEEAVAAYALTYRYSKNKDATRRLLEAQTTNGDDPQVMQAAKAALALSLIGGGLKGQPAPTTTPPPQEAERPQQEAASQQAIQSAASRCTGDQIEKMINAGFSKEEIVRLCETTPEGVSRAPNSPTVTVDMARQQFLRENALSVEFDHVSKKVNLSTKELSLLRDPTLFTWRLPWEDLVNAGQVKLTRFEKTNGSQGEFFGTKFYKFWYRARLEVVKAFSPSDPSGPPGLREVTIPAGKVFVDEGDITFCWTEKGWSPKCPFD